VGKRGSQMISQEFGIDKPPEYVKINVKECE